VLTETAPASFTSQLTPVPNPVVPGTAAAPHLAEMQMIREFYQKQGLTLEQGLARDAAKLAADRKAAEEKLQAEKDALLDVNNGIMKHYLSMPKEEFMPEIDFIQENIQKLPTLIRVAAGTNANYAEQTAKYNETVSLYNAAQTTIAQLTAKLTQSEQTQKAQETNALDANSRFTKILAAHSDAKRVKTADTPVAPAENVAAQQQQYVNESRDWWAKAKECQYIGNS
jgi:hypothetical protein